MNKLDKLALEYGADKYGKHNYTPYYYELFGDKRNEVKKVIEIGAGEGASLRMWMAFFPYAQIYSGEIDQERVFGEGRIQVYKCDQSSLRDLVYLVQKTGSDIDLFVDDGSHKPEDQVFTCLNVLPLLSEKTIYVIEDVADPNIIEKLTRFNCKLVRVGDRYDDQLLVVKQK